ncbi:MAG TPA: universal stress protein [Vicinamibacterales bacterium]
MKPAFKQILVPTDFSNGSRLAVDYALELARRLGASVHLLHVVEDPTVAGLFTEAYVDLALIRKERRCDARHRMNALLTELKTRRITDEIAAGPVAQTIAGIAADRGADFIVMGTHGRTGLAHVLVGSVAEHVIRIAGCPVLTVREGLAGSEAFAAALGGREAVMSA